MSENSLVVGKIYPNKYGDVKVIEKIDKDTVIIEFLNTNIFGNHTKRRIKFANLIHSSVKDPYAPTIYGVACKGNAITTVDGIKKKEYIVWFSIITKTYGPTGNDYNSVCKEWLCYECFLRDITLIENYNEWYNTTGEYSLVKLNGYRQWNLESCMFAKNDLVRLIQGHGSNFSTPYLGVTMDGNVFRCTIGSETYGRFNNAIAAANMFNLIASNRGYPERVLNKVPYMDIDEIMKYKLKPHRQNGRFQVFKTINRRTPEERIASLGSIKDYVWKNHGDPVRIINDRKSTNGKHFVDVEFINPNMYGGYTVVEKVAFGQLVGDHSAVVDYYKPTVMGVGCRGYGASYYDNGAKTREYILWTYLLSKCYNQNDKDYMYYGAQGVTVCHRWLCFEYFYEDLPKIQNYELWKQYPGVYSLDKDYLQQNVPTYEKVYSPETCIFLSLQDNTAEKQLRLAEQNNTGPIGVYNYGPNYRNLYKVVVNNRYYGAYNNINAAASMYNKLARSNGRGEEFVNKIDREMSLGEIAQHQVLLENESPVLCRLVNPNKSAEDYKREFIEKLYGKK